MDLAPMANELPNGVPDDKRPEYEEEDSIKYPGMKFKPSRLSSAEASWIESGTGMKR
jgi:hypothetical protein